MTYQSCCRDALSMYTVIEMFPISPSESHYTGDWDCLCLANLDRRHGCLLSTLLYWASYHHINSFFICFLTNMLMLVWFTLLSLRLLGRKCFSRRNTLMCNSLCVLIDISDTITIGDSSAFIVFVSCNFTIQKLWFPLAFLQLPRNSIKVLGNEMTRNDHPIKPRS